MSIVPHFQPISVEDYLAGNLYQNVEFPSPRSDDEEYGE